MIYAWPAFNPNAIKMRKRKYGNQLLVAIIIVSIYYYRLKHAWPVL